jgi:GNAT superfamily N-acetyltransferase
VVTRIAYRRSGIGTSLPHHALSVAWAVNCYKVMLLTGSKCEDVHRFYEHFGFVKGDKTGFVARP